MTIRAWVLLVLFGLAGCGRFGFAPPAALAPDGGADGPPVDADRDGPPATTRQCIPLTGGWTLDAPVRVPGVNAPELDGEATISPDGLTLYFASDRGTAGWDSYRAVRTSLTADFGKPVPQSTINTGEDELRFLLAPDGLTAYLNAEWAGGAGKADIWVATRQSTAVQLARSMFSLVQGVNTADNEYDPWVSPDGLRLYFFRSTPTSDDLWLAERASTGAAFATLAPLAELNSAQVDDNPTLTADELVIVFSTRRPGGAGNKDLWYAVRADRSAPFTAPRPLPVVNSTEDEGEAWIHTATCELFFSSWRGSSLDIYRSRFVRK